MPENPTEQPQSLQPFRATLRFTLSAVTLEDAAEFFEGVQHWAETMGAHAENAHVQQMEASDVIAASPLEREIQAGAW